MKNRLGTIFIAMCAAAFLGCASEARFPELRGGYLGQTPPGPEPVLFAPGIVSTGLYERDCAVTRDGEEIFYGLIFGQHVTIMHTRLVNGRWTEPEIAPFARDLAFYHFEPALAPDGSRLFFLCTRPPAGHDPKPGWAYQNIWAVDRRKDGSWGDPYDLGAPVNTDDEEYFPSVTREGTIYFTRLASGEKNSRIWRARRTGEGFGAVEALPAAVNGDWSIFNACVAPDESFLVACVTGKDSSLAEGLAQYYVFFRDAKDGWSEGANLGERINTPGAQALSPSISADGRYLFFASTKANDVDTSAPGALSWNGIRDFYYGPQNGLADIYWVETSFIEGLRR